MGMVWGLLGGRAIEFLLFKVLVVGFVGVWIEIVRLGRT